MRQVNIKCGSKEPEMFSTATSKQNKNNCNALQLFLFCLLVAVENISGSLEPHLILTCLTLVKASQSIEPRAIVLEHPAELALEDTRTYSVPSPFHDLPPNPLETSAPQEQPSRPSLEESTLVVKPETPSELMSSTPLPIAQTKPADDITSQLKQIGDLIASKTANWTARRDALLVLQQVVGQEDINLVTPLFREFILNGIVVQVRRGMVVASIANVLLARRTSIYIYEGYL